MKLQPELRLRSIVAAARSYRSVSEVDVAIKSQLEPRCSKISTLTADSFDCESGGEKRRVRCCEMAIVNSGFAPRHKTPNGHRAPASLRQTTFFLEKKRKKNRQNVWLYKRYMHIPAALTTDIKFKERDFNANLSLFLSSRDAPR